MPTGYTDVIADDINFNDFAMRCARAMGALILMRDEHSDAPIPERFEPNDYYIGKIAEANARLSELQETSKELAAVCAQADFDKETESKKSSIEQNNVLREKYVSMLEKVEAWVPPSADHSGFKNFMIEQITSSIRHDCDNSYYLALNPVLLNGDEWLSHETAKAEKDLCYYTHENIEEIKRTDARNLWVKNLRDSLEN